MGGVLETGSWGWSDSTMVAMEGCRGAMGEEAAESIDAVRVPCGVCKCVVVDDAEVEEDTERGKCGGCEDAWVVFGVNADLSAARRELGCS